MGFPGGSAVKKLTAMQEMWRHQFYLPWRRKWQPTPVFWKIPGKSHGQRSLWATVYGIAKESDITEQLKNNNAWHTVNYL